MVRRLGLGKNNHLTYASLALNPRYLLDTLKVKLYDFVCRSSGVEVVKIGDQKMSKSPAELAAEFRKNRLYGNNIPRETSENIFPINPSPAEPGYVLPLQTV